MGGKSYQISPDEWVFAALSLYLDITQVCGKCVMGNRGCDVAGLCLQLHLDSCPALRHTNNQYVGCVRTLFPQIFIWTLALIGIGRR